MLAIQEAYAIRLAIVIEVAHPKAQSTTDGAPLLILRRCHVAVDPVHHSTHHCWIHTGQHATYILCPLPAYAMDPRC